MTTSGMAAGPSANRFVEALVAARLKTGPEAARIDAIVNRLLETVEDVTGSRPDLVPGRTAPASLADGSPVVGGMIAVPVAQEGRVDVVVLFDPGWLSTVVDLALGGEGGENARCGRTGQILADWLGRSAAQPNDPAVRPRADLPGLEAIADRRTANWLLREERQAANRKPAFLVAVRLASDPSMQSRPKSSHAAVSGPPLVRPDRLIAETKLPSIVQTRFAGITLGEIGGWSPGMVVPLPTPSVEIACGGAALRVARLVNDGNVIRIRLGHDLAATGKGVSDNG